MDLNLNWMLLNVRSNPYHNIWIMLWNVFYAMQGTFYELQIMGETYDYVAEACQRRLLQWKDKALRGEFLKKVDGSGELSLIFKWSA